MLLAKNIKAEQISEILNPFLTKILGKRPVVRAAGIAVYANVISLISTQLKSTIFESLAKNINKEPIIVRQSFTASCPLIIPYLDDNQISTLLSIISIMAEDDCFSVSCEIPNALAKYLEQHSDIEQVLKIGDKLLNSKNWRVKCTYIDSVSDIFKGHSIEFGMIYPILKKVVFSLVEEEDEVKTAAAQQMHFLSTLQNVEANKIKILFKNFFSAHCPHIKTAAISQLPYYVGILDNDYIINQFKGLVKDSSEEVKIAAIETLQSERIPTDIKLHCIEISSDSIQWREKDEIVRLLPQLSGVPDKKFDSSFMQLLFDDAFNVRKAALELLPNLISQRKESFKSMLMRRLWSSMDGDDYQLRQTAVLAVIKGNLFDKDGIEILKQAAEDEIPNVRLTLAMNIPRDEKFADIIAKLKKDSDEDVANCFN
ncbi:HEAT repeat family protein [Histomonas meleagridis]|uniref:HEAT repeat family protein n=1 Tax=Histomonas meleagridis TaxID=135588 RepID=UPI00355A4581|nr:HEAT repeat family protein [Histomonas meleagridis]KAH0805571.1 HEAT repeat family protein [Histomonas meleagridis]